MIGITINPPDVEEMTNAMNKLGKLARVYQKEFDDLGIASMMDDILLAGQTELEKHES